MRTRTNAGPVCCDGEMALMGRLGRLKWFRCRNCGLERSRAVGGRRKATPARPRLRLQWKKSRGLLVARRGGLKAVISSRTGAWTGPLAYQFDYKIVGEPYHRWFARGNASTVERAVQYVEEAMHALLGGARRPKRRRAAARRNPRVTDHGFYSSILPRIGDRTFDLRYMRGAKAAHVSGVDIAEVSDEQRAKVNARRRVVRNGGRPTWFRDGYAAGVEAAKSNLQYTSSREELLRYAAKDRIGEFAGEIREHQAQFAGDISYDVGRTVTERQFEDWERGFYKGFEAAVKAWIKRGGAR